MSEKLATIERIHSIITHPNADSLEVAKIKAWPVCVKKGEYQNGDLVIFIVIDSLVPETAYFEFLRKQKFRVWNARFRGQVSSGLVCPFKAFDIDFSQFQEGSDLTELLGIKKYERPIDLSVNGQALGTFPSGKISQTDEYNFLSYPEALDEFRGSECYLSTKIDGCLHPSTEILTEDGLKTIENIINNSYRGRVASLNINDNIIEFDEIVNHSIREDNGEWFQIETETGETLIVTAEHLIWLPDKKCYRKVKNLQKNEIILLKK